MTAAYRLNDVRHCYGDRCVVDVPDMEIASGEILAIVGPSGAGKSTLLRLLDFLETPTHGTITYAGSTVDRDVPLSIRRDVTTVFQRPVLLRRTVAANVRIGRRLRSLDTKAGDTERWLERLGLTELADAPARTLSAGEAQRVAFARALIVEPSVLLLDEPTGNLDPYNVGLLEEIVRTENADRGTTVVVVTHDVFQARRIADRTALMVSGNIVELSETETFFAAPEDARTAAFLRGDLLY